MNQSESFEETPITVEPSGDGAASNSVNAHPGEQPVLQPQPKPASSARKWLLIATLGLLVVGGGVGWRWLQASNQQQSPVVSGPQGVPVTVSPVESGTITQSSDYVASVESRKSVTFLPQITGQVTRVYAQPGQQVKAGTPIIEVNPAQQQASVNSATAAAQSSRAAVGNEQATLRAIEAERQSRLSDLRFNQQQYQRFSKLFAEGAVTRQDLDQATDKLRQSQATLAQTEARITAQQAAIAEAQQNLAQSLANVKQQQVQLNYYRITAPFDGVVGNIPVKVGDYVTPTTTLGSITQNASLEVNISIPIERAPELRLGMPVELLNAQGEPVGRSSLSFISPNVNTDTQSILVKSIFANTSGRLRADQFIRVRVIWDTHQGVLVPTSAVSRIAGQDFVFVAQTDSRSQSMVARQKPVKLGDIQGNNYQVIEGLKAGEQIVTSGIQKLSDGAPIIAEDRK